MTYRKLLFTITIIISIISCKTKINQMVNHQREGKWITTDTLDSIKTYKKEATTDQIKAP
jgi:hypothetical protein